MIIGLLGLAMFASTPKPVFIDGINGQHADNYLVHADGKVVALKDVYTQSYLSDVNLTVVGIDYGADATYMHVRIGRGVEGVEPSNERILPKISFLAKLFGK